MKLYCLAVLLAALSGFPGLFLRRRGGTLAASLLCLAAGLGIAASASVLFGSGTWNLALPYLPLLSRGLLRFDPVAAFFLVPVLLLPACGAIYGISYWDDHHENARQLRMMFGLLTASMALLVASDHALTFLLGWEGMALAAFFLVMAEDRDPGTQKAAWIYLVSTHTGTLILFGAFALLSASTGSFALANLPAGFAASRNGTVVFLLFLTGFGFKAGVMPLHFWLPPAHAAAPSHVSSVMSGVMIKMGILGLVRFLAWIPDPPLWWGGTLVALGAVSGILGVAFALGQHDLKRLLAYHSIENIGIILLGLGLGTVGKSTGHPVIMVLGYAGGLLHVINHSLFKGLLFLAAGSAVHATGTRDLEQMGGLAHGMPWTSGAFLVGAWAICGLPPLNGFVSEWFIYLGAFRGLPLSRWSWSVCALTALALIGALALACFAKAFGVVFQGQPRSPEAARAQEAPPAMLVPMGILAGACAIIGLAPMLIAPALDRVVGVLAGAPAAVPSLASLVDLRILTILAVPLLGFAFILWKWAGANNGMKDLPTWDCGYAEPSARMQYTASSFADGLVAVLSWALYPVSHGGKVRGFFPFPRRYHSHVPDPVLDRFADPALDLSARGFSALHFLQAGYLPIYLLYVLLTLLTLLVWMVV